MPTSPKQKKPLADLGPSAKRVSAVILAAGSGTRFGSDKLQALLNGKPVYLHSVELFLSHPWIDEVILVTAEGAEISSLPNVTVVVGGANRSDSARNGVAAASHEIVLIHDAARPYISFDLVTDIITAAQDSPAVVPAIPVTDTIKEVSSGKVLTLDREKLRAVQTPQAVWRSLYLAASESTPEATDDMAIMELAGVIPTLIPGELTNTKITFMNDLPQTPTEFRTGLGYDIHSFSTDPERPLWLCGVEFDDRPGLEGHSDADAAIHALVDSILGAVGLGDIGQHFPNTDPEWKDCPSLNFLAAARDMVVALGWRIVNVDLSIIAERPKIMARHQEIRETLSATLKIDVERVSVKATTNEKLGAIGRSEGIAAFATATLSR